MSFVEQEIVVAPFPEQKLKRESLRLKIRCYINIFGLHDCKPMQYSSHIIFSSHFS